MADDARLQIVLEAKIDKLTEKLSQANSLVSRSAHKMSTDLEEVNGRWESLFLGEGPGKAIERVFSRSRLAVFEEGGAKIGVFGNALEALGPIGLTAAAALAAVGIAAEETRKALEYADDIDRTSKSLGISTTALQEYDYAFAGTSVGIAKGREALASFNEVFGKYSAGLASGKSAKFLDALGFTPESARELGSTQEALEKTLTALAKIKNSQQRASLATQLGLSDFLVVLAEGQEGVENFVKATKQAQSAGAVISPDDIKHAAELNDKLEQVEHTVSVDLKKAFIELGPAVLGIAQLVERIARGIAQTVEGFRGIAHYDRQKIGDASNSELGFRSAVYNTGLAGKIDDKTGLASGGVLSFAYNNHQRNLDQLNARRAELDKLDAAAPAAGRAVNLAAPAKAKAGPEDQTPSFDRQAIDAYQSSLKALSTAVAGLTGDIEAHAELERQAVDADLTKKLADLDAQEAKIRASKVDANKQEQILQIELAKSTEQIAAKARIELINRNAIIAAQEREIAIAEQLSAFGQQALTAQASLATSAQRRADLELQAFTQQQFDQRNRQVADLQARSLKGEITQDDFDSLLGAGDAARTTARVAERERQKRTAHPLYDLGHPLSSIGDDIENAEVAGLKSFNDELTKAVTGAESLGDAFRNVANSIIADLARIAIQRLITQPLANALFGRQDSFGSTTASGGSIVSGLLSFLPKFADGGIVGGSGGPRSDNVLARLSPGEMVLSNSTIRSLSNLRVPRLAQSGGPMTVSVRVDAAGAFGREELKAAVRQGVRQATADAVRLSGKTLPGRLNALQQLGT